MINNIRFKIIAGKFNKIPEFYTIFARKMPDYIIKQRARGQVEAKRLRQRPRPKLRGRGWPRGHFGLEDLTSLQIRASQTYRRNCFTVKTKQKLHCLSRNRATLEQASRVVVSYAAGLSS